MYVHIEKNGLSCEWLDSVSIHLRWNCVDKLGRTCVATKAYGHNKSAIQPPASHSVLIVNVLASQIIKEKNIITDVETKALSSRDWASCVVHYCFRV